MKVLLTHGYFLADDEREQRVMKPYPPLGLLYIAAHLRAQGHPVTFVDSTFGRREEVLARIERERPDVLGIYVNLMTRANVVAMITAIRSGPLAGLPIVLGGPETRAHAERFLQAGASVCVIGEGERTMEEVVRAYANGGSALATVNGIAFRSGDGRVASTPEREKLRDLDVLPLPARDLIDLKPYLGAWRQRHGYGALNVSTMRGCPYTCRWCSRGVYGLSYRRRSPAIVVDELESIVRDHAPERIWFVDDVFTISHKWLASFAEELERRRVKIAYECITRADRMNAEVIGLLRRSGCVQVWIGAESGSQRIIDAMDRRVDVHQVREMIRASRDAGIGTGTFIMLGYPGETESDILETVAHLKAAGPDQFTITLTYPISGTELHAEVRDAITEQPEWATGSDRQIDFRRTYPPGYYHHAVRFVTHAVNAHRRWADRRPLHAIPPFARSIVARAGMWIHRSPVMH